MSQCQCIAPSTGKQCRNAPKKNSNSPFCHLHQNCANVVKVATSSAATAAPAAPAAKTAGAAKPAGAAKKVPPTITKPSPKFKSQFPSPRLDSDEDILAVLEVVRPGLKIEPEAIAKIHTILNRLRKKLDLTTVEEVKDYLRSQDSVLPGDLAEYAINELTREIALNSDQPLSFSTKTNLQIFSRKPSKLFEGTKSIYYSPDEKDLGIAIAMVLEYVAAELLENAGSETSDRKKRIITLDDLNTAISEDNELAEMMNRLGVRG
jgi:hypothetical protein